MTGNATLDRQLGNLAKHALGYEESDKGIFIVFRQPVDKGQLRHIFGGGVVTEHDAHAYHINY